jgi:peroxiredoxin
MDRLINVGDVVENFSLPDLKGKQHSLNDYLGKIVVVNFWSAECPWAKRFDDSVSAMLEKWGEEVVLLQVAANANETIGQITLVAEERELAPILLDNDQAVARMFGAFTTPHVYVIDREGILRYQGAWDDVKFRQPEPTINYLEQAVDALLAGKLPDPDSADPYGCTVVYQV